MDYGRIWESREKFLKKAYAAFLLKKETVEQKEEAPAAELRPETREFCLYQSIKNSQGGKPWTEWDDDLRLRKPEAMAKAEKELAEDIAFREWVQSVFAAQWKKLKDYANEAGIRIIGDMPIYVAPDSADAWAHPELFQFDADARPLNVAGCPPDYFSPDGQFWGNPLYEWEYHKKTGYAWWLSRMEYAFSLYDYVRVDHFRGFDEYYAIPAGRKNAKEGSWNKGPGMEIFERMQEHFAGRFEALPIIAEDLGLLTDSVRKLLQDSGFPGMRVLEFAFDSDSSNLYLPHNFIRNCVAYTGTHDNEPLAGWIRKLSPDTRLRMIRYQGSEHTPDGDLYWDGIRTVLSSIADTVIIPMQDYLGAGEEARINTPAVTGNNWKWRMLPGEFRDDLIWHCGMLADLYGRNR